MDKMGGLDTWVVVLLASFAGVLAIALGVGIAWYCISRRNNGYSRRRSSVVNGDGGERGHLLAPSNSSASASPRRAVNTMKSPSSSSPGPSKPTASASFETNRGQAARRAKERAAHRVRAQEDVLAAARMVLRGSGFALR
jgi:cytoskeletal protein RodZ